MKSDLLLCILEPMRKIEKLSIKKAIFSYVHYKLKVALV
ncbi:hypothetical protein bcere0029_52150 [Bacillus cereus AH1272]|nr:hypothetical protein bcere0029_52150 [Bacillus cereus AH1272]EEL93536.1 hypothetical protein bcere0030_23680 [Bacillus cereus AH1273]